MTCIILACPSLSHLMLFGLIYALPSIKIAKPAFLLFIFAWCNFVHPLFLAFLNLFKYVYSM